MKPFYDHAGITIYNADCVEAVGEVGPFDLVITDPPYASGGRRDAERMAIKSMTRLDDDSWFSHDTLSTWGFTWFMRNLFVRVARIVPKGTHVYCFTDWRQAPNVYAILESAGLLVNNCLVWDKGPGALSPYWRGAHENIVFASAGTPAAMLTRGVYETATVLHHKRVVKPHSDRSKHPTEKPLSLILQILAAVPGDVVFDPFLGSGTTLVAAKQLGRRAIGIEINEEYCEMAVRRLSQEVLPLD